MTNRVDLDLKPHRTRGWLTRRDVNIQVVREE